MGELINNKNPNKLFDQVYNYFPRLAERKKQMVAPFGWRTADVGYWKSSGWKPEFLILDEPSRACNQIF